MRVESTVKAASVSKWKANVRKRRQQFRRAQIMIIGQRDSEAREEKGLKKEKVGDKKS